MFQTHISASGGNCGPRKDLRAGSRTSAWMEDEFVHVDGIPHIYTVHIKGQSLEDRMEVRIPGLGRRTVGQLRFEGHRVVMPRRVRPEPMSLWRGQRLLPEMR